ncbi:MAG: 1,4-alpha-glucan branching protein GlgB [Gammaproteobacteria bacterium]
MHNRPEGPRSWDPVLEALASGQFHDPFAVLGPHLEGGRRLVRVFRPEAEQVELLDRSGAAVGTMERVHPAGVFEGNLPPRLRSYRLRVIRRDGGWSEEEDPYRFPSTLGDLDLHLLGEGSHQEIYRKLGAHLTRLRGVAGCVFSVWAPNARRVSVIGDFNDWDGRRHVMRLHPANGIWEIFVPGVGNGAHYKFELLDQQGRLLPLKADPVGQYHERPPGNASITFRSRHRWRDEDWMRRRGGEPRMDEPVSIYEVHLGSWRRHAEDNGYLGYDELAEQLTDYVTDMGFTHVELLPVTEHPFDGSWGYQPIGLFAPTHRFGDPDGFRRLVDRLHGAGIGVIADWVPAHFPRDEHGLARFDGTALYEHADPRKGAHADWGTLIFNYGRREVINYLAGSALYWIREFHIDGLRVDAVASMLYLDYSREQGDWVPNEYGGNENLEAVSFLREFNVAVHRAGATSFAEESTAWPGVSRPVEFGGLGFTFKWNMGWMNDTLSYMSEEPVHRKHHHDKMTFGLVYAFDENFVLPLSHDEVVHGKRSLLGRMPGDEWQQFANLRAYFGFMYGHPGKKLLFMGGEFAQRAEWNHDQSLDWHLLEQPLHRGMQRLVRDLNHAYRSTPALHQRDFGPEGFEWIDWNDRDSSVFSWVRRAADLEAEAVPAHGRNHSLRLTLPPLATVFLAPADGE